MVPLRRETYQEEYAPEERPIEREQALHEAPRPANRHVGIGRQIRLVLFVLSIAAVCLAVVGGYERLALEHQSNLRLKDEIEEAEIYIEDLTVELEYSMDPTTVQEVASKSLGMDYPTKEQLVMVDAPVIKAPAQEEAEPDAAAAPEPSFVMPEVARAFTEEAFEVIGMEDIE